MGLDLDSFAHFLSEWDLCSSGLDLGDKGGLLAEDEGGIWGSLLVGGSVQPGPGSVQEEQREVQCNTVLESSADCKRQEEEHTVRS